MSASKLPFAIGLALMSAAAVRALQFYDLAPFQLDPRFAIQRACHSRRRT